MERVVPGGLAMFGLAVAVVTSTVASPRAPVEAADVVITGANVITMDADHPATTAVAMSDGRIVGLGDDAAAMVGAGTQVVEAGGRTVIPGLVDAHGHWFEAAMRDGRGPAIQEEMLRNGITAVGELAVGPDLLAQLEAWDAADRLQVRTSAYLLYGDACGELLDSWWRDHPPTREPGETLRIGGLKLYADGGSCGPPAVSFTYLDGSSGALHYDVDELAALLADIDAAGYQAAVHAAGDRAVDTVLRAHARVNASGVNPRRHRIEHSAVVRPELRDRYGPTGVVAVIFGAYPTCFLLEPNAEFQFATPPEFHEWEWPWRQLMDANPSTVFAWQTDYPVLDPSLGRQLEGFVTRTDGGCVPTSAMAAGAITVDEALRAMTVGSAYALDWDTEVGSITVGKLADLVVLSADPYTAAPRELRDVAALATILGGDVAWCAEPCLAEGTIADGDSIDVDPLDTSPPAGVAAVRASAALADRPPSMAVDGDPETGWGSGQSAPQWIELDLGAATPIERITLVVDQYPAGHVVHRILGGPAPNPSTELAVLDTDADHGDVLEATGDWTVRFLRIETVVSPSWVAWLEIEVA